MLLHFIFVIKKEDLGKRETEFEYITQMAEFFKVWIKKNFAKEFTVKCDQLTTTPRSILQKLDTHTLIQDHSERGKDIFHFYLCHFRPLWTDCTCEGYSAENFGMVYWNKPKNEKDTIFLAERNCTVISHEITHELLRQAGHKKYMEEVHERWTQHTISDLPFEAYGKNFEITNDKPMFLTMNVSNLPH